MIKGIKGVKDLLPEETPRWRFIEEKARFWASTFGFHEIRVPIFEVTTDRKSTRLNSSHT